VDLLFASNEPPVKAAQMATSQIPIVFAGQVDPVRAGLIQSFARPGGNITGVANLPLELAPKRLQIFQEILPGLKRVLYVYDASDAQGVAEAQAYRAAARHLWIELVEKPVQTQEEAQTTLTQVRKSEVDGILKPHSLSLNLPGFVLEATVQRQFPSMFDGAFWTEQGGLASYGPDFYEAGRQAARLVDKVLKGEKPGGIPVETNHKIELVINLKTAEALELTVAPAALLQADRLIR
jgi:putative ABC transport system substrate-binding protein